MNSYGLVLAGGGAKGAYQIGAWKALKEMGITFNAIAGTSIGSINGALIAADDYESAHQLWLNISIDKGLRINEELPDPENLFSKKNWGTLFREVIKNGGLDASPAAEFVSQYVNEAKVRENSIPFFVVTVQMTQGVTPREISIDEIPEGKLTDYLMASSNIPLAVGIGPEGEKYLDGGVYYNIPIITLKKRGYNKIIILDISNLKGVGHTMNTINSQVIHIKPYNTDMLGGFMDLDAEAVEKRIQLGYFDAKKAFSHLLGNIYYFLPETFRSMVRSFGADAVVNLEKLAFYLSVDPYKINTETEFITAVKQAYEAEKQRLRAEAEVAERERAREKERENELTLLRNAIKKRWATVTSDNEDSEELTDESIAADTAKEQHDAKEREFDSIRNVFKKHFGQKHPLDEFSDAITLLDNFII